MKRKKKFLALKAMQSPSSGIEPIPLGHTSTPASSNQMDSTALLMMIYGSRFGMYGLCQKKNYTTLFFYKVVHYSSFSYLVFLGCVNLSRLICIKLRCYFF